jgi:hypothetical protein
MNYRAMGLASILCVLLLGGCITTGQSSLAGYNNHAVSTKIKVGKTTKSDVLDTFGRPGKTTSASKANGEIWTYTRTDIGASAMLFDQSNARAQSLQIEFNRHGVVIDYVYQDYDPRGRADKRAGG